MQSKNRTCIELGKWPTMFDTLKVLVSYLDNSFEKAISECYQSSGQHETIKLLSEEARVLHQKLKNFNKELNRLVHEKLLISDKNCNLKTKIL